MKLWTVITFHECVLCPAAAWSDLVVMGLGVLDGLKADGHDRDGRRGQVFDHSDQVATHGQSLHFAPADRLVHQF